MIKAVNFSITNACSADCVYCPKDRGESCGSRTMSLETFELVLENIRNYGARNRSFPEIVRLGENGDLFLNGEALKMLRRIRTVLPSASIEIYNHFRMISPAISDALLGENLVDAVFSNVDGTERTYREVKKTDFDKSFANLRYFIGKRAETGKRVPISIRVMTLRYYSDVLRGNFGVKPAHVPGESLNETDDFPAVEKLLKGIIDPEMDRVGRTWPVLWAERHNLADAAFREKDYSCPQLFKNRREIYVSPAGTWYLCCLDSRQELVIGDLTKTDVRTLMESPERQKYLQLLSKHEFSGIGGPCRTVHCCQVYSRYAFVSRLLRALTKYSSLAQLAFDRFHNEHAPQ